MKILYVTTIGNTMSFFKDFIKELLNDGNIVDIATNDSISSVPESFKELKCRIFSLSCNRSPINKGNLIAIKQIRNLVKKEKYDIVHCHTPIAAACTRLACRKLRKTQNVKVIYTAHGFHFYKGAPKLNWLVYYPIEKICSYFTDKLITINREDYQLAKKKMKAKEVCYVPGVGIDLSKFKNIKVDRNAKRREIGVPEDCFLLLSVGELNENKNHQIIIKALAKLNIPNVHYAIAGVGEKKEYLIQLSKELGVSEQVHLFGYRNDIPELNYISDVFCFPSFREGLSVSLMEAMACGLPVICSEIRGNVDLINSNGGIVFPPDDINKCKKAIEAVLINSRNKMGKYNKAAIKKYSTNEVLVKMKEIYYDHNIIGMS